MNLGCTPDSSCARRGQSEFVAQLPGFDVEVVQHFHVIGDEADGCDDDGAREISSASLHADDRGYPARAKAVPGAPLRLWYTRTWLLMLTGGLRREPSQASSNCFP